MEIIYPKDYDPSVPLCCIYMLTNKKNGKVYIGQTVNYRKRSSDYANAANKKTKYSMYRIITEEGADNFKMEVLLRCHPNELAEREEYYIKEYDATNPEKGYNIETYVSRTQNTDETRKAKSLGHIGLKETADTKRKKSNYILAVKDDMLIICDSGKLFGDFVGKSKDYIKNCLRQPSKVCDFRLYYADYEKRKEIEEKMWKKRCIRDKGYMDILYILNTFDREGVETIDQVFDVYELVYNEDVNDPRPVLKELGTDYLAG